MPLVLTICLLLLVSPYTGAQELDRNRDSIPQALRQPQRGEAPRYPRDLVIGSLEQGNVPAEVRRFALEIMSALSAGNQDAPSLSSLSPTARRDLLSSVGEVRPRTYRVGEGREEVDGSYSFLVRFLGREQGIAGELYIRFRPPQPAADKTGDSEESAPASPPEKGGWILDDLLLEEKRNLGEIVQEPIFDLPPYERLY
jgi:hypothetical protein